MADAKLPATLSEVAIAALPEPAYYIPDFISPAEEETILKKINAAPLPTWRYLSHRRLQTYPSPLTPQNTLLASPLPSCGEREDAPSWRVLQEPRSLLITSGGLYKDYLHGITETNVDKNLHIEGISNWDMLGRKDDFKIGTKQRETRVSLTFRDVLKVKTLGKGFGFLGKGPN